MCVNDVFFTPASRAPPPQKKKGGEISFLLILFSSHPARKSADVAPCDRPLSHPSAVPGPTDSSHSADTASTVCLCVPET